MGGPSRRSHAASWTAAPCCDTSVCVLCRGHAVTIINQPTSLPHCALKCAVRGRGTPAVAQPSEQYCAARRAPRIAFRRLFDQITKRSALKCSGYVVQRGDCLGAVLQKKLSQLTSFRLLVCLSARFEAPAQQSRVSTSASVVAKGEVTRLNASDIRFLLPLFFPSDSAWLIFVLIYLISACRGCPYVLKRSFGVITTSFRRKCGSIIGVRPSPRYFSFVLAIADDDVVCLLVARDISVGGLCRVLFLRVIALSHFSLSDCLSRVCPSPISHSL